jgi:hypothetical protein
MSSLAGLAVLVGCGVGATPAGATLGYINACGVSQAAMCTGGFSAPAGLAVDNSSGASAGHVWFNRYNPERLVEYDASGDLLKEIPLAEGSMGKLGVASIALRLAVDPGSGDFYLSSDTKEPYGHKENEAGEITKFTSSGEVLWQIAGAETPQGSFGYVDGLAVDPATGDLYAGDSNREVVDVFSPEGKYLNQFAVPAGERLMTDLASDSKGDLFLGLEGREPEGGGGIVTTQVREYTRTGAPINCPSTSSNVVYESPPGEDTGGAVAVDPSDDHLFISERAPEGDYIAEYATPCAAPSATFGEGGELGNSRRAIDQFGVSGPTHAVYLGRGALFELVPIPLVATGAQATNVTRFSASINGTVNPEGASVIGCEFEYGGQNAYIRRVPCEQPLPLGGTSPIVVSAKLEGLGPDLPYYYRLRALIAGGSRLGLGETFTTKALSPPVIGALPASGVSQFAATLNSSLAPGETSVNYHFEYGTSTSYGRIAPIPDNYSPSTGETITVSQPIAGLLAGTIYHYRLVASSPGGTEVKGPDQTFTTLPVPAPTAATGGASEVGVGSATLSGAIDPHGWDTTYLFEYGTTTAYGASWPTIQVDMGALEGPQPVVVTVPSLQPKTTYHYRLLASNGGGTSYGQDMTFTTGEYPAQMIQEPPALTFGKVAASSAKKKHRTAGKHRRGGAHHRSRHGRASGKQRRAR